MTSNDYKDVISLLLDGYYIYINRTYHPIIRNYNNIIKRENYIKLDIIEKVLLESGEIIAIIKTFWIKIIQRKWKKYYSKLISRISFNKNVRNRLIIELTGKICDI
jgi:recombinational DNA repair ATPase RecF